VSNPEGRRDWLLRYRPRGQTQKAAALGAYPAVSLSKARQRAGEIIAAARRGIDLISAEEREAEERRAATAKARPLSEMANTYLDRVKRLRSWRDIESRIRCHIMPKLGSKPIGEITRADVVEFLDALEHEGLRHQINRCRESLRAIFAFAIERGLVTFNPVIGVSKRKVVLLTGARRNEVRRMAWSELDLDARLWRLPAERNKSARSFEIPLSNPVVEILQTLPRIGPLVFTLDGKRPMSVHHLIKRVRSDAALLDMRLHDLRRTLRTGLAELGVSFEVAERVLNHAMPGLEAVYNRHSYAAEKRNAQALWAEHVLALVEKREATVVAFRSANAA
jgi:integrase